MKWSEEDVDAAQQDIVRCADAYENGAEAMRSACLEAVRPVCDSAGTRETDPFWRALKAAIEGAMP